jgi:type I restriction enzyme S subunit
MVTKWETARLGDIIDIFDSQRVPLNSRQRKVRQGPYPYYGAQGVIDYIDEYIFDGRHILVAEDGENLNSRKLPLALFAKGKFWVNNHAHIIRANPKFADDIYLLACLNTADIKAYVTGAAQPKLSQANMRLIEIPLPPLPTQRRIASILSAYDDLIENNNKRIKILEEMARMLYREWFVHFRFPGHEKVKMVDSPLGKIPEGWEVVKLGEFGKVITGKTPSTLRTDYYGNFMPFVKTPSMHGKIYVDSVEDFLSKEGADSQKGKTLPAGTPIVNCIGALAGVVGLTIEPCQTNQQINAVVLSKNETREFIYFSLCNLRDTIRNQGSTGATMINLSKGKFEGLDLMRPRRNLMESFHGIVEPLFLQVRNSQLKNINLRQTRDLLLPRLISGDIDVDSMSIEGVD